MNFPFESDPAFAALSYDEQTWLRVRGAVKQLQNDPEFLKLSPSDQEWLVKRSALKPPVFSGQYAGSMAQTAQRFSEAAKKNDFREANAFLGFSSADKKLSLLGIGVKLADKLLGGNTVAAEMMWGEDSRKLSDYARSLAGSKWEVIGSAGGTILDLLSYSVLQGRGVRLGPSAVGGIKGLLGVGAPKMAALGFSNVVEKILESTVTKAPLFAKWLVGTAVPAGVRVIASGLQGVGREALLSTLEGKPIEKDFGKIASTFGEYAGLNTAFWTAVNVALPFATLAFRVIRGARKLSPALYKTVEMADGTKKKVTLTAEEIRLADIAYAEGRMDDVLKMGLGQEALDRMEANAKFDFYRTNPEAAMRDPYGRAVVAGYGMGKYVIKTESGYRIREIADMTQKVDVENIHELDLAMAGLLKTEAKNAGEEGAAILRQNRANEYLFNIIDSEDNLISTLEKAKPENASSAYKPLTKRLYASPLEARTLAAVTEDTTVVDTFSLPMSKMTNAALTSMKTSEQAKMLKGVPSVILSKGEAVPNALGVFNAVAPVEELASAEGWAKRAIDAGSGETVEALIPTALRRAGWDAARLPDGSLMALYPERLKILDNSINPKTGRSGAWTVGKTALEETSVAVHGLRGSVGNEVVQRSRTLMASLVDTMGKDASAVRIKRFGELAAKKVGFDGAIRVSVLEDAKELKAVKTADGIRLLVPSTKIPGKPWSTQIITAMDAAIGGGTDAEKAIRVSPSKYTVENLTTNAANLEKWFLARAKEDPAMQGWLTRRMSSLPEGISEEGKWLSITQKFMDAQTTPAELKAQLGRYGVRLIERGDILTAVKDGKAIATAASPAGLLEKLHWNPPRMNSKYGPKVASIDPDGVTFFVNGGGVSGKPEEVLQFLDHFEETKTELASREILTSPVGAVRVQPGATFEAHVPSFGLRRWFDNASDAAEYINGGYKKFENLAESVERKGGVLRYVDGKYRVYMGTSVHEAATIEDLGKIMERFPDPAYLPDLVPEDLTHYFKGKNPLSGWYAKRPRYIADPPPITEPNFRSKVSMMIKPMTAWITDHATKVGDTETLARYTDLEMANRVATREIDVGHGLIDRVFDDTAKQFGFKWNEVKEQAFYHWMETADDAKRESIKTAFSLRTEEVEGFTFLQEQMRRIMGESPTQSGTLFRKFGVDPKRFLFNYMSRVRDRMDSLSIEELNTADAVPDSILDRAFEGASSGVPKEIKAWFTNMRTADVASWALDTNARRVFKKYITRGNLAIYADEPWRNFRAALSRPGVDPILQWRGFRYMDMLQGGAITDGEKLVQAFGSAFMQSLGKKMPFLGIDTSKAARLGKDSMAALYSLSYATKLGWRPFSAIRNFAQVYQTTGVMIGHSYVAKAMRRLAEDKTGELYRYVKNLGEIHDAPPIVNAIVDSEKLLGKVTQSSMSMFTSADEWSRVVGYIAGEERWADVVREIPAVNAGNAKRFVEELNANFFGPEISGRIAAMAQSGNLKSARHLYAHSLGESTLFLMRREQAPVFYHGFFGKMLGQFGNFAASYSAFVGRAMHYGTPAQKAAFYSRWLLTGAAFAGTAYALGMRYEDWLPWAPMQFTGGPLFTTAVNVLHAIGQGYSARQARGELNAMLPIDIKKLYWKVRDPASEAAQGSVVQGVDFNGGADAGGFTAPITSRMLGYYQVKAAADVLKYMEEGNPLLAFYALTSVPIRSDLR